MLQLGTRFLGTPTDRETARAYGRLARLLPQGHYHAEKSPERLLPPSTAPPLHPQATHLLPIGWEQRVERPSQTQAHGGHGASATSRVFYIDHAARTTTLVDPRVAGTSQTNEGPNASVESENAKEDAARDAQRELLLLAGSDATSAVETEEREMEQGNTVGNLPEGGANALSLKG